MEMTSQHKQAIAWAVNNDENCYDFLTYPRPTAEDDGETKEIRLFIQRLANSMPCGFVELEDVEIAVQIKALETTLKLKRPLYTKALMVEALEMLKKM